MPSKHPVSELELQPHMTLISIFWRKPSLREYTLVVLVAIDPCSTRLILC